MPIIFVLHAFRIFFYYGVLSLFVALVNGEHENRIQKGNGYFQVPPHTPVIFGEAGGRTLFRCVNKSAQLTALLPDKRSLKHTL